jgi:hypothetical protein
MSDDGQTSFYNPRAQRGFAWPADSADSWRRMCQNPPLLPFGVQYLSSWFLTWYLSNMSRCTKIQLLEGIVYSRSWSARKTFLCIVCGNRGFWIIETRSALLRLLLSSRRMISSIGPSFFVLLHRSLLKSTTSRRRVQVAAIDTLGLRLPARFQPLYEDNMTCHTHLRQSFLLQW